MRIRSAHGITIASSTQNYAHQAVNLSSEPSGRLLPSLRFGRLGEKVARFRQVNTDRPNMHHDALEFPNGQIMLVTRLCEGQHATVLQLPASPRSTSEAEGHRHGSLVAV